LISPLRTFVASFFALLLTGFNFQQIHIYVQDTDYITALLCCNIHKGVKMRCSCVAIFSLSTSLHTTCMQFHLSQQMTISLSLCGAYQYQHLLSQNIATSIEIVLHKRE
jgi:hypothetical protein